MPPKKGKRKVSIDPAATNKSDYRLHRNHKLSFQEKYDEEMRNHLMEMSKIRAQRDIYKKDSERILRVQNMKFGITLDNMKVIQSELEMARFSNEQLLGEMKRKKEECDILETSLDDVKTRLESVVTELTYFKREKRFHNQDVARLVDAEATCSDLMKSNSKMRLQMVKHNVSPDSPISQPQIQRHHSMAATVSVPSVSKTPSGSSNKILRQRATKSLGNPPVGRRLLPQIHEHKAMTHRGHNTRRRGTWAALSLPALVT